MALPQLVMTGTVVEDPTLRFTPGSGTPVVQFRVACNKQVQDPQTKEWRDGDVCFLNVETWRNRAENAAETLKRGVAVTVIGELRERSYETKEGEKRKVYEVINASVAVDLSYQVATVQKKSGNGQGRRATTPAAAPTAPAGADAPAAGAAPAAPAPVTPPRSAPTYEEPPF